MSTQNNSLSAVAHGTQHHSVKPFNPQIGDYWTDSLGNTEIWDGVKWVVLYSNTRMATTSYVSQQSTVTFNHSQNGRQVTADEIIDFMDIMKRRMLIVTEEFEKLENYPMLKEAYEHYKLIERLCCGDEKKE